MRSFVYVLQSLPAKSDAQKEAESHRCSSQPGDRIELTSLEARIGLNFPGLPVSPQSRLCIVDDAGLCISSLSLHKLARFAPLSPPATITTTLGVAAGGEAMESAAGLIVKLPPFLSGPLTERFRDSQSLSPSAPANPAGF